MASPTSGGADSGMPSGTIERLYHPPRMEKHKPSSVSINDRVVVDGKYGGTLRYWGTVQFSHGNWAGVELDTPNGKNDGRVAGKRYFSCKENCGLFVKRAALTLELQVDGVSAPTAIENFKTEIAKLTFERDEALAKAVTAEEDLLILQQDVNDAKSDAQQHEGAAAALENARAEAAKLKVELLEVQQTAVAQRNEAAKATAERDSLKQEVTTLRQALEDTKAATGAVETAAEATQKQLAAAAAERAALQSSADAATANAAQLKNDLEAAKLDAESLAADVAALKGKLAAKENEAQASMAESDSLEQKRKAIVAELKSRAQALEDEITAKNSELRQLKLAAQEAALVHEQLQEDKDHAQRVHERQLQEEQSQIALLQGQIDTVKAQAATAKESLTAMQQTLLDLGFSTPTEAADAIQGLKTEVDQLRGEISQVHGVNQGALESQQAKYKEQIEKLAVLQAELGEKTLEAARLQGEATLARGEVDSLQVQLDGLQKNCAAYDEARRVAEEKVAQVDSNAKSDRAKLESQLAEVTQAKNEIESQLAAAKAQHAEAQVQFSEVSRERLASVAQVKAAEDSKQSLLDQLEELQGQHNDTLEELDGARAQRADLEQRLQQAQGVIAQASASSTRASDKVAKLEKALQATKQELGHIKQQFDQRELEYKAEGDEIKEEFAEVNETVASLQQTNATLEEAHAATKAQLAALSAAHEELVQQHARSVVTDEKISALQAERDAAQTQWQAEAEARTEALNDATQLQITVADLSGKLSSLQDVNARLLTDSERSRADVERLTAQLSELKSTNEKQIYELKSTNETLRADAQISEAAVANGGKTETTLSAQAVMDLEAQVTELRSSNEQLRAAALARKSEKGVANGSVAETVTQDILTLEEQLRACQREHDDDVAERDIVITQLQAGYAQQKELCVALTAHLEQIVNSAQG